MLTKYIRKLDTHIFFTKYFDPHSLLHTRSHALTTIIRDWTKTVKCEERIKTIAFLLRPHHNLNYLIC